ncbi:MAG: hypothetical protein GF334_02575 [Candidatus Altiarchaeales archaeon]|nr:hypothetical protein [Candidatus Altiarchaeales archaeon]
MKDIERLIREIELQRAPADELLSLLVRTGDQSLVDRVFALVEEQEEYWRGMKKRLAGFGSNQVIAAWGNEYGVLSVKGGMDHLYGPVTADALCGGVDIRPQMVSYRKGFPDNLCGRCARSKDLRWPRLEEFREIKKNLAYSLWGLLFGVFDGSYLMNYYHLRAHLGGALCGARIENTSYFSWRSVPSDRQCPFCLERVSLERIAEDCG